MKTSHWLAAMLLLASPVAAVNSQVPAAQPQAIDIDGAGALEFSPDNEAFEPLVDTLSDYAVFEAELGIADGGRVVNCTAADQAAGLGQELCRQLRANATYKLMQGYDLAGQTGRIRVQARVGPRVNREAEMPIQFVGPGRGTQVSLMYSPNLGDYGSPCFGSFGVAGQPFLTDASYSAICPAFLADKKAALKTCRKDKTWQYDDKAMSYDCWIVTREMEEIPPRVISVSLATVIQGVSVEYLPRMAREQPDLRPEDGHVNPFIGSGDYPARALRNEMRGRVQILVGVTEDGKIASCRPIKSSGYALLDNTTCRLALSKGKFLFGPEHPKYEGLRFKEQVVSWSIPT